MPLVRIVIPTYNRASLLREALESVILQSFSDFEVIVVDDGSTDDTEAVLQRFSADDSRVRYMKQSNRGSANARNRAIREPGQYSYVAFLDSDDLWYPHHLEESVAVLQRESKVALVFSRMETINIGGHWTAESIQAREKRMNSILGYSTPSSLEGVYILDTSMCLRALLRSEFAPLPSTVVIRREAVLRPEWFNAHMVPVEDLEFFLDLAASYSSFSFINSIQVQARYYGDNLTGSRDLSSPITLRRQQSVLQYKKAKLKLCSQPDDVKVVSEEIAETSYFIAQCYAEQLDLTLARRAYLETLHYQVSYKALKGVIYSFLPVSIYSLIKKWHNSLCKVVFRSR